MTTTARRVDALQAPPAHPADPSPPRATPRHTGGSRPRRKHHGPDDLRPRPGRIPGLDGIRALAIIGVLVFHFTPTVLPGGFLGVDVFFVVSGFLITTLLTRELTSRGRLDLPRFWLRRARRLLPALLTVVVVSIGAARLVGGDLLVSIGRQALGALTFSTNWLEIGAGASYFHNTSPLLFVNFWSLAVEEQFYLFWPLLLVVLLAFARTSRQRLYVVGGVALGSALLMAVLYQPGTDATRVYYGTDTHLFGLMLGVALAFAWAAPHRAGLRTRAWRRWRPAAVVGALALLVLLMRVLGDASAWTFRGGMLLACLATVVLIAALLESDSPWRRVMEMRPLVWVGSRSYGIYLWHWPVLMIAATLVPYAPGTVRAALVLGVALTSTLVLSEVSHRFIETPVREHGFTASLQRLRDWATTPWEHTRVPRIAAGALAALFLLSAVAVATAPDKSETQQLIEEQEARLNGSPGDREPAAGDGAAAGAGASDGDAKAGDAKAGDSVGAGDPVEGGDGPLGPGGSLGEDGRAKDDAKDKDNEADGKADDGDGQDPETKEGKETDGAKGDGDHPFGYQEDEDGLLVPDGEDITAIGDSLVVTSADGLEYRFPGMTFEAKSNRQWKDAMPVLDALEADAVQDNVIVHFGTNAGVDEDALRAVLDTLGPDRQVVVMNLYSSSTFVAASNKTIEEVAGDYRNVVVGDWHGAMTEEPETLQSDRIHPDIAGMHVYARVVAESFDELARTS